MPLSRTAGCDFSTSREPGTLIDADGGQVLQTSTPLISLHSANIANESFVDPVEPSPKTVTKAVSFADWIRPYNMPVVEIGEDSVSKLDHLAESAFTVSPAAFTAVTVSWSESHWLSSKYP